MNVSSQTPTDFSTIKADELSDVQIRQLMQRAESVGYSDAQFEQMALAQGMQPQEAAKLKARVDLIRKSDGAQSKTSNIPRPGTSSSSTTRQYITGEKDSLMTAPPTKEELINQAFEDLKPKIFGADLFKNSNIIFEPNMRMATPENYIIGPDDQLLIDLTGDNEASYELRVTPDGTIRLPYVGTIAVGGLSIEQARIKIRSTMSGTYTGLRSDRSNISVNLGNIRSIRVTLNGQVVKPGTYTLSSLSSVFNALYASGGPSTNGSFRKIRLIRNNKVVSTIDLYDFLITGIQKGNLRLQDQDVIHIPVYDTQVELVGEVKNPAIYESLPGDSFRSILDFAGGFSNLAYSSRIKVFQNTDRERRITDIFASQFDTYVPKNGDKYFVEPILDRFENKVEIIGAVFRPGMYELEKGLTLSALIRKAEGLKEDAFMNRAYISRLNPDNTLSLESFDPEKIMMGTQQDILLRREDKITISSIFDLREEYKITVQGEVRQPNVFPYAENMRVEDAVQLAGGFKDGATPNRIEVSRRVRNSNVQSVSASTAEVFTINIDQNLKVVSDTLFRLQPFDIISVRSDEGYAEQKQVRVEGEILYPGKYTIKNKNERISDIIARAGGLTPLAYTDGASLKRPGRDTSSFRSQRLGELDQNELEHRKEEEARIANLQRLTQAGVDTAALRRQQMIIVSDLVGIDLTRILKEPGSEYDLLIEDGDIIRIPKQLQTVKVSGEVLNPNSIVYQNGRGFKRYVNGAGGFTGNALKKRAYIKYANGSVEGVRKFIFFNNYPTVKPGAEILVPRRAERQAMSAQAWVGLGSALASLGVIIVSLFR